MIANGNTVRVVQAPKRASALFEPQRPVDQDRATAFGPELKRVREALGVSQSRLAERADFNHSYVSRLESSSRLPTLDAVERLADALDLAPDSAGRRRLLRAAGFDDGQPRMDEMEQEVRWFHEVLSAEGVDGTRKEAIRDFLRSAKRALELGGIR